MDSYLPGENCFICCEKPVSFHDTSDSGLNVCRIICQHFWFKEDELQSAIVCGICWEKVDQFHQFYLEVQKVHEQLEAATLSVFIKQEESEIEVDQVQENYLDLPGDDEKLFDVVNCKIEIPEECNELLKPASSQKPWKKRKYTRRSSGKRIEKRKKLKPLTPEQRKAEDDFIKQHTFYFCDECNMEFDNFLAIRYHLVKVHQKDGIACCGTRHRTRSLLYQHVQNVLNPEAFKCEVCSGTFKTHTGYLLHKKKHHTDKKEPLFKCHRCERSFTTEVILNRHLRDHDTLDNETAKCEVCGKCYNHQRTLRRHIKMVHQKQADFICEICSKGFYLRSMLLAHRKSHELTAEQIRNEKRKQCPVCNKCLKSCSYVRHVRSHEEEGRQYKCEMCAHVSRSLNALRMHSSRKHAPDRKRYVCDLCGKEYSRPATLREHVANAHTGEPLYQCQNCEEKFFSNATMYKHRKKNHPQELQEEQLTRYAPTGSKEDGSDEAVS